MAVVAASLNLLPTVMQVKLPGAPALRTNQMETLVATCPKFRNSSARKPST